MAKSPEQLRKKYERHIQIPHRILEDPRFIALPPSALRLLLAVLMQFNGKNNGHMQMSRGYLKEKRDWHSAGTISNAKKALLESGLVIETQPKFFGRDGRACARFGIAWLQLHYMDGQLLTTARPPAWRPLTENQVQKTDQRRQKMVRKLDEASEASMLKRS